MQTKICSKCKIIRDIVEFYKDKSTKDGFTAHCKKCRYEFKKNWIKNNSEKVIKHSKVYRNSDTHKKWLEKNKERRKKYLEQYRKSYKNNIKKYAKKYYQENKETIKIKKLEYQEIYKEKISKRRKKYYVNNREKIFKWRRKWANNKYKTDSRFKLDINMSKNIRDSLKRIGNCKNGRSWETLVGYTSQQLMEHLEKQFKPEMNWENYGSYWHIDHIRPKNWFKYINAEDKEFKKCWALENLQPLEAAENVKKGNRYEG